MSLLSEKNIETEMKKKTIIRLKIVCIPVTTFVNISPTMQANDTIQTVLKST